mmetsp:Transcript_301/g.1029  ORF Transcript_301/g.1029 Transcript_301/m.1029 type:complete len:208 (+) Transcript_301:43-666(+)
MATTQASSYQAASNDFFGQAYGQAMDLIGFGQQGAQQTMQNAQTQANQAGQQAQTQANQAGQQAQGNLNSVQSQAQATGQQMQTQAANAGQQGQQQAGGMFSSFQNLFVSKDQQVAEQYGTNVIQMYGIMEKYSSGKLKKEDARQQCQQKMDLNESLGEVNPQLVDRYLNSNNIDANKRVWMRDIWDELTASSCIGSLKDKLTCGRC